MNTSASCPTCHETTRQHKAGTNSSGTSRHECQHCHRTYTLQPKPKGYHPTLRQTALKMYVDGISFRRIARLLQVSHQTVINWVNAAAAQLPTPASALQARRLPPVETLEMDELFTFVGEKKRQPTS